MITAAKMRQLVRQQRDLLAAIAQVPLPRRRHHPATLVFQALRIAVNEEYAELDAGLEAAVELLAPGGRLAVLSYHSGEDRLVKNRFRDAAEPAPVPAGFPAEPPPAGFRTSWRGARRPSTAEVAANPRASAARLRALERAGADHA